MGWLSICLAWYLCSCADLIWVVFFISSFWWSCGLIKEDSKIDAWSAYWQRTEHEGYNALPIRLVVTWELFRTCLEQWNTHYDPSLLLDGWMDRSISAYPAPYYRLGQQVYTYVLGTKIVLSTVAVSQNDSGVYIGPSPNSNKSFFSSVSRAHGLQDVHSGHVSHKYLVELRFWVALYQVEGERFRYFYVDLR
jgi:hypothetical protein